jgi:hypothetical protein
MENRLIKYEKIMNLTSKERYIHSIKEFVAHSKLWGLYDEGWALLSDEEDIVFPLWPDKYYAEKMCMKDWKNYSPKEIDLDDFLENYIDDIKNKGFMISIFMNEKNKGIVVSPDEFLNHLEFEIDKY